MKLVPYSSIVDTQALWMEIYDGDVYDIASKMTYTARMHAAIRGAYVYATRQAGTDLVKMYKSVRGEPGIYAPAHWADPDSRKIYPSLSIPNVSPSAYARYNFLYRGQNPIKASTDTDSAIDSGTVLITFGGLAAISNISFTNRDADIRASFPSGATISYLDPTSAVWKPCATIIVNKTNIVLSWNSGISLPLKTTQLSIPVGQTYAPRTGLAFYGSYVGNPPRTFSTTKRFAGLYTDVGGSNPIYLSITSDITKVRDYDIYMPDMSLSTSGDRIMPIAYTSSKFIEV